MLGWQGTGTRPAVEGLKLGGRTMFRARRVAAAFPARKACSRQDTLPLAREERDQDADDWDRDAELGFHSALEIRRV